jgi:lysophospholipase L1-like esterase
MAAGRRVVASFLVLGLATWVGAAEQEKVNSAVVPKRRTDEASVKRHERYVDRAKQGNVDVLFVGDSITQGWDSVGKKVWEERFAAWKPANFGVSGDRTQHVLWRITEGKELDGIDPKVIVLMIGTNNFADNSAEEIAAGVAKIVGEFRHQKPKAKVLVLGVFPRNAKAAKESKTAKADELHPKAKDVNDRIAALAEGKFVYFLDIGNKFLDAQGGLSREVMPDYLHLSPRGYAIWADAIEEKVNELLKTK